MTVTLGYATAVGGGDLDEQLAALTADGVDLGSAGQHRSTTTWTYMVHDNLFSSGGAKTLQGIIGVFR